MDEMQGWFRVADLTDAQLERIRETSYAMIESNLYDDPLLCVIAAYVAEVNIEYQKMDELNQGTAH